MDDCWTLLDDPQLGEKASTIQLTTMIISSFAEDLT